MITHRDARLLIYGGFAKVFARQPSRPEAQCVQAVGWIETQYGAGWDGGPGEGSNNIGAITKGASWTGETFENRDSTPQPDGSSVWSIRKFRRYASQAAGFEDLIRAVYLWKDRDKLALPAGTEGNIYEFSRGLYTSVYYEGFGATDEQRIEGHRLKILDACIRIARELSEPMPDGSPPPPMPPRILRLRVVPLRGDDVAEVQSIVGVKVDGVYGPATASGVAGWQARHGLKSDGIWGPVSRALSDQLAETAPTNPILDPPPVKPIAPDMPELRRGDMSEAVRELQRRLNSWRRGPGRVLVEDGKFGERTELEVKAFQMARGLISDGVVGPRTWTALLEEFLGRNP